jgi:peptidoglycan/LPS O-acetylase OafA/YrhL
LTEHFGQTRTWPRLDGVDLLRGLAIFAVLMNHVNMRLVIAAIPYGGTLPEQVLSAFVWNGQHGVQIFFAISGFLITATSLRRWRTPSGIQLRDFYLLRFARIAPLLILLLVVLVLLHFTQSQWFHVSAKTGGVGRAVIAALAFHINVLEAQRGYLPGNWDVLWSLSVEEMFYLVFPLVFLWLGRNRWLLVLLATVVLAGPFARTLLAHGNEIWMEYSYLGGMDAIALGCLTALILPRLRFTRTGLILTQTVGAALMAFILGFSGAARRLGLSGAGLDMTIVALGACLVIAAVAASGPRLPAAFGPLQWLGRRSYEVYMTHMFVVIGFFVAFTSMGSPPNGIVLLFAMVVAVAALAGELVARYYSEPMNRYLRNKFGCSSSKLASIVIAI